MASFFDRLKVLIHEIHERLFWQVSGILVLLNLGCADASSRPSLLTADMPLHLEDHLDAATVEGSEVSADLFQPVEWHFDEPQPGWKATPPEPLPAPRPATVSQTEDALRITLGPSTLIPNGELVVGGVYVDVPEWDHRAWAHAVVRTRSSGPGNIELAFNVWDPERLPDEESADLWEMNGEGFSLLAGNGTVQTHQLLLRPRHPWEGLIQQFGVNIWADDPIDVEILSITVVPQAALYADRSGITTVRLGDRIQSAIWGHAPGRLEYRISVPEGPRLDLAFGLFREDQPVTFRVDVAPSGGASEALLEEILTDPSSWIQHTLDLSAYAGQQVTIGLEMEADSAGAVGFWGAPTLSGSRTSGKPNVIFYVIDAAGADWMSLYGYNLRTTPFLERLAGEAVVFENAYSNATSTPLSTPSYMTSLLYSAIDRFRSYYDKIPDGVTTMAQHFGTGGYQTGVFVSNPFAATAVGLERGVDLVRVIDPPVPAVSSEYLHRAFWDWREAYPGTPFWAHFQTTDVHGPLLPTAPFSGLFITPERRADYDEWLTMDSEDRAAAGITGEQIVLARSALYSEGMAHQDHHLERFVARLKAEGQWENTILVIASDHGVTAGTGIAVPGHPRDAPHIHPFATHVPLMFVWPGRIVGGRRIRAPVSMIDVLPTLLDLTGLPQPELRQGHSLAPLLLGQVTEAEWETHPLFVDVLVTDQISGELVGNIEVIDGRWGAALCLRPDDPEAEVRGAGTGDGLTDCTETVRERLLVYDLWDDPLLERPINEERPDLVDRYTKLLETQVEVNAVIRELISGRGQSVVLRPEDLEILRSLGYIN
jgi:arylsulfatase A-like enzyme